MLEREMRKSVVLRVVHIKAYWPKTDTVEDIDMNIPHEITVKTMGSGNAKDAKLLIQDYIGEEPVIVQIKGYDEPQRVDCIMPMRQYIEMSTHKVRGKYYNKQAQEGE